ncbi:MAG: ClbS/DfsB family four-helix bundle protein [Snodgrassella sp.]|jgi:hypothetical protein|uniref:ClbS/DfsB family four-helix bundle protein n=1 Tax=Snodgrassella TaxID=1193515 RepID=UPI00081576B0|nr:MULTISPECIES: ClbS/DfsB family four-helix bundle protein [Snodgrassella]MCO6507881.1 ClbS/DfsB family four-helix bundle protein [Snodgrassella sp.]MCO6514351.1 ClbS/DfsB family four-helix bundle protein [Snodgrassella sp.]MCO6518023.1 ClbS/DfsB family four-helix bundle protein [Snodgrassella sp.]MCO6520713.1 ClbS/DfsB family four-helix bundle protein [Snodgrassella sp.]MCO6522997.1 ClbS/DfsB family four-helix bundle protein [Snodgrassella sp.]
MAIPESKNELIEAINKNYALLIKKLMSVPAQKAFEPLMQGHVKGSTMSVAQLVSYLIGWGELVLSWHVQEEKGQEIIFPEVGFKWNELGQLAQKFYYDYKNINDYNALLRLLDKNKNDIIKLIEGFSNEALYEVTWYGKYTRGRMIQLNTSSPYKNASGRLTALLKKLGS